MVNLLFRLTSWLFAALTVLGFFRGKLGQLHHAVEALVFAYERGIDDTRNPVLFHQRYGQLGPNNFVQIVFELDAISFTGLGGPLKSYFAVGGRKRCVEVKAAGPEIEPCIKEIHGIIKVAGNKIGGKTFKGNDAVIAVHHRGA